MSSENTRTDEPSRSTDGEGCQDLGGQSRKDVGPKSSKPGQRIGGVGGGGGPGRMVRVSCENCSDEVASRTSTTGPSQAKPGKAGRVAAEVGAVHSSVDPTDSTTVGERRDGTCPSASQSGEGRDDGQGDELWIKTSPKVRKLQRVLYRKAKAQPQWRFYSLYGELSRLDLLTDAVEQVISNQGAPGVDGFRIETLAEDATVRAAWLFELSVELQAKRYQPSPLRRVYIWKDHAKTKRRALGIPTVKDRVVQSAAAILLQPIWEADFHEYSYAYRPQRRTHQAMDTIRGALLAGKTEVIDADLTSYFDTIPHRQLMQLVAQRVSDGSVLRLIKAWLRAPIIEENRVTGKRKVTPNTCGTPQGGVISPGLANLYLNALDHEVNDTSALHPTMVRFADDLVILARPGDGSTLLAWLKEWLQKRELQLNEEKTRLVDSRKEPFCFLGFAVSWRQGFKSKRWYPHVEPSAKSQMKLRDKVRLILNVQTRSQPDLATVETLNQVTRGWATAFHYGNSSRVFNKQQHYVRNKLRHWLHRKYDRTHALFRFFTDDRLHGQYHLWHWPRKVAARS
jgi:RNA-directed DNA polymerase